MPKVSSKNFYLNSAKEKLLKILESMQTVFKISGKEASRRAGFSRHHLSSSTSRERLPPIEALFIYILALGGNISIIVKFSDKTHTVTIDSLPNFITIQKTKEVKND
jgi:hypothetical protein